MSRIIELKRAKSDIVKHLYVSCRCAIAHAYNNPIIDPDEPTDLYSIHLDLPIIEEIAEYLIENEFKLQEIEVTN